MTEKFSSALAQNLKITSKESAELRVIINYINKISEGYKGFCKEYLDKIPSTDKLGVDVIQSTCISDYFNYNSTFFILSPIILS